MQQQQQQQQQLHEFVMRQQQQIQELTQALGAMKAATDASSQKTSLPPPPKPPLLMGPASELPMWIATVEAYLEAVDILHSPSAVTHMGPFLRGKYLHWWNQQKARSSPPFANWAAMREALEDAFEIVNSEQRAREALDRLRQKPGKVVDYIDTFNGYLTFLKGSWSVDDQIHRFIEGLDPSLQLELRKERSLGHLCKDGRPNLQIAQRLAQTVEEALRGPRSSNSSRPLVYSSNGPAPMELGAAYTQAGAPRRQSTCFRCGSADHWIRDCPHPPQQQQRRGGQYRGGHGGRGRGRGPGRPKFVPRRPQQAGHPN